MRRFALSLISLILGLATMPAFADVSALKVDNGMHVKIICGKRIQLSVKGRGSQNVRAAINGASLELSYAKPLFGKQTGDEVNVRLTLGQPLQSVLLDDGVSALIPACALDPTSASLTLFHQAKALVYSNSKSLIITMDSGAEAHVRGQVGNLALSMSGNSIFNSLTNRLAVDNANVTVSQNSQANLCAAQQVLGTSSYGGKVNVNPNAMVKVDVSNGGQLIRNYCSAK